MKNKMYEVGDIVQDIDIGSDGNAIYFVAEIKMGYCSCYFKTGMNEIGVDFIGPLDLSRKCYAKIGSMSLDDIKELNKAYKTHQAMERARQFGLPDHWTNDYQEIQFPRPQTRPRARPTRPTARMRTVEELRIQQEEIARMQDAFYGRGITTALGQIGIDTEE